MWNIYDDLQSNTLKNNYILKQKLAGGMLWKISGDRTTELIGNTYTTLFGDQAFKEPTATTSGTGTTAAIYGDNN